MPFCPKCNEYIRPGLEAFHVCPPVWLVINPDDGDDDVTNGRKIQAHSATEAAEKWAEEDDAYSAEYSIVGGEPATVLVARLEGGPTVKVKVTGEQVPCYYGSVVDDDHEQ